MRGFRPSGIRYSRSKPRDVVQVHRKLRDGFVAFLRILHNQCVSRFVILVRSELKASALFVYAPFPYSLSYKYH